MRFQINAMDHASNCQIGTCNSNRAKYVGLQRNMAGVDLRQWLRTQFVISGVQEKSREARCSTRAGYCK